MKTIKQHILERLVISKTKKEKEFNIFDSSYTGKIQLSSNVKLEFHRIYNEDYNLVCCSETWVEGIKDTHITLIVKPSDYDNLLQYVYDYDEDWDFAMIDEDKPLFKQATGLIDEYAETVLMTTFDKWYESRKKICANDSPNAHKIFESFATNIQADLR